MKPTQTVTSAATSINKTRLPAIYGRLNSLRDCVVLDYGCGRYTDHIRRWCTDRGIRYLPYDKYNQSPDVNRESIQAAYESKNAGKTVIGICSNVLNVIDSEGVIEGIVTQLNALTTWTAYTVYEGDKTGNGRYTQADCYQRNETLRAYVRFIPEQNFQRVHKGMIIAKGN